MERSNWAEAVMLLDEQLRVAEARLSKMLLDGAKFCQFQIGSKVVAHGKVYLIEEIKPVITRIKMLDNVGFSLYGRQEGDKFSRWFALEDQCTPLK